MRRKCKIPAPEIIDGLFRAGQLVTLSGWMNVGKTPLLEDWAFAIATGTPWCGKTTLRRPVILFGLETPAGFFRPDWARLARRLRVPAPLEPDDIELYLDPGDPNDVNTQELHKLLPQKIIEKVRWIETRLASKPNALVIIDPFDLLFRYDKLKGMHVLELYGAFRAIHRSYPDATFLFSFNCRKVDRRANSAPSLLEDPHGWVQETSGSLDIINRSDTRLGFTWWKTPEEGVRVFNGLRRRETMEPLLLEPAWFEDLPTGYQVVPVDVQDLTEMLAPCMLKVWNEMADQFTWTDLQHATSRTTAYRLRQRIVMMGLVIEAPPGVFQKQVTGGSILP